MPDASTQTDTSPEVEPSKTAPDPVKPAAAPTAAVDPAKPKVDTVKPAAAAAPAPAVEPAKPATASA